MRMSTIFGTGMILAVAAMASAPAVAATQIGDGTVSSAEFFNPNVDLTTSPATFTVTSSFFGPGATFQTLGTGSFADVTGHFGRMSGIVSFSKTVGQTVADTLANFFTFDDGHGGNYSFSLDSVRTDTYSVTAPSSSITLYLLGTTLDTNLMNSATPTSLTLQFNRTAMSAWSASSTLAIPPAGSVPEPSTWALGVIGFGAMGFMMRRRTRTTISFA